jgi:hypothetical protein
MYLDISMACGYRVNADTKSLNWNLLEEERGREGEGSDDGQCGRLLCQTPCVCASINP